MKEECIAILRKLTGKDHIYFTDRGNTSILLTLKLAQSVGKRRLIIQDQGGWLTYKDFGKKLKFEFVELKTDHGLVRLDDLRGSCDPGSVFLLNSMPGYFCMVNEIGKIADICKKNGTLMINDASGSIGTDDARYGDLVIGSFGKDKPVEVQYGGFISTEEKSYVGFFEKMDTRKPKEFYADLLPRLNGLPARRTELLTLASKIKSDLKGSDIINRDSPGFNVIVKYKNENEKQDIIGYCNRESLEYTMCPRYIRVLDTAVSIEVKRKG
jgi:hypothetical protein